MRPTASVAVLLICLAASPAAANLASDVRAQLTWSATDSTAIDLATPGPANRLFILLTSGVTSFKGAEFDLLWDPPGDGETCAVHTVTIYRTSTTCTYLNRGATLPVVLTDEPGHLHVAWSNTEAATSCTSGAIVELEFDFSGCADPATRFKLCSLIFVDSRDVVYDVASYGVPATVLGGGSGSPPCNNAPILAPIPVQVVNSGDSLTVTATAQDPDNDPVTYSILEPLPDGASFDPVTGVFAWRPRADNSQVGGYPFTVHVADPGGATDETDMFVSVTRFNHPPTIEAIEDQTVPEGTLLDVPIAAFDADMDVLSFSIVNGYPSGATVELMNGEPHFRWTPDAASAGFYPNVTIKAIDGHGGLAEESFDITVLDANFPPAFSDVGDYVVDENLYFSIQVAAIDPDGDSLTFTLASIVPPPPSGVLPTVATISPTVGQLYWTPTYFDGGILYTITVQATDVHGASDQEAFQVRVDDVNAPPLIRQQPDTTVVEAVVSRIALRAVEPDGDMMQWSLVPPVPPWASLVRSSGTANVLVLRPGYASAESLGSAGMGKDSIKVAVRSGRSVRTRASLMVFILTIADAGLETTLAPATEREAGAVPDRAQALVRPNPFAASLEITYAVPGRSRAFLAVYDAAGRRVSILVDDVRDAGWYEARWDGRLPNRRAAPAGTYYLRGAIGETRVAQRLVRAP